MPTSKLTLTPTQEFWLAFIVAGTKAKISKPYRRGLNRWGWNRVPRGYCWIKGAGLRTAKQLAKKKLVKVERDSDTSLWKATPTEAGIEAVKKYKPDTPERQVQLWGHKAPQLRTLAKFINEHMPKYKAELIDWSYTPETHLFGNVSSFGQTRRGKKLEVRRKKGPYQRYADLSINGPDPMDTNDKGVRWIADQMGIRLEA